MKKKTYITIEDILDLVSIRTNLELKNPTRKREQAYARALYFKLCRVICPDKSLEDLAKSVNKKSHCSVIHGLKIFDNGVLDRNYYTLYENLLNDLNNLDENAKVKDIISNPRSEIIRYYEEKISKVHLEYLDKIKELNKKNEQIIENKAILDASNELSKLSDGDIYIFIETRLKPFILTRHVR